MLSNLIKLGKTCKKTKNLRKIAKKTRNLREKLVFEGKLGKKTGNLRKKLEIWEKFE
jgi:hypothetical protein